MDAHFSSDLAALFLPLLGALAAGVGGHWLHDRFAQIVTCCCVLAAAVLSCLLFYDVMAGGHARTHILAPWIDAGDLKTFWSIRVDALSAVMFMVVNVVSAMVHVYAVGYMHHDRGVPRFMSYLSLFTFFMLMLVSADNMLQMFFGWEGVGLASYLLIGFWYEKPSACAASMKAFLVNRVGDFGFLLGIFGCYELFGSLDFETIFKNAPDLAEKTITFGGLSCHALTLVSLLLFMGAMGKSAQIGLHTWLPDAMEGPTPVSALIHAATMVTAGVFMVARLSYLFEYAPTALAVVTVVGAVTALVAATMAMAQFDIKRVIAYSTMSQLGYMFIAAGVSAYNASIFHLMTHAFFKALLFLAAGSVIHAMGGEQDMRKMRGLWRKIPVTYTFMWIGSLALAGIGIEGVFGFAGFYSKDLILEAAFAHGGWTGYSAYAIGLVTAFLTAFYSLRLLVMTFHGQPEPEDAKAVEQAQESSLVMLLPLGPLALGALIAGAVGVASFGSPASGLFWHRSILILGETTQAHHVPALVRLLPLAMALLGGLFAWWLYVRCSYCKARVSEGFARLREVALHKYYFDDVYDFLFVRTMPRLGEALWRRGDDGVIDRFGPDGAANVVMQWGQKIRRWQSGFVYDYALAMGFGLIVLVGWVLLKGGVLS